MWGSDQSASVEMQGFSKLIRDIRNFEEAYGDGKKWSMMMNYQFYRSSEKKYFVVLRFIKFKINIQDFLKRYLILSLIIIILNFIFFTFLDNFYYLTLLDYPIYDFYIINLISTILIISIIYLLFIKNKKT